MRGVAALQPLAETATLGPICHELEPPATAGALGAVRSMLTSAVVQADEFPSASSDRHSTIVAPSAKIEVDVPATGVDHVAPLFVDVRYS